jgi:hypothetical protein
MATNVLPAELQDGCQLSSTGLLQLPPLLLLLQEVYSRPDMAGSFDAVVTCFFIDTAHNILECLEVIHK